MNAKTLRKYGYDVAIREETRQREEAVARLQAELRAMQLSKTCNLKQNAGTPSVLCGVCVAREYCR